MIRILYFICNIFVKNIIIYWLILASNHQGSYFPFLSSCSGPSIFVPQCTLIFSRTRKQNWIVAGGEGVGVRCFKIEGVRIFSTCFVCVWGGGGGRLSTSPSVKKTRPPPSY